MVVKESESRFSPARTRARLFIFSTRKYFSQDDIEKFNNNVKKAPKE